jgi:membrane protease YdiL (CAAX protease family)
MISLLLNLAEWAGAIGVTMLAGLSPRFRRRPLIFAYPRREGLVALGGLLLVAAILWTSFPGFPAPLLLPPETIKTFTFQQTVLQVAVAALACAPFLLALILRRQPLLSAGLGKQTRSASLYLGLALALLTLFLRGKIYTILGGISTPQALYLAAMLAAGLASEFIFRGFVQLRLSSWLGDTAGWLASAGIYALWQLPQKIFLVGINPNGLAPALLEALLAGLVYGWIMRKSGNVLASGIYAAIHNWAVLL